METAAIAKVADVIEATKKLETENVLGITR
jgi:hypothetical protein